MFVEKFFRQLTEEELDGKKPGRNSRQPPKRRREEMLTKFFVKMQNKMQDEEGQGLVEYALIIVLVSVALIAALGLLAGGINKAFSYAVSALTP
jgi:pilus assembly protein Flp/PilA